MIGRQSLFLVVDGHLAAFSYLRGRITSQIPRGKFGLRALSVSLQHWLRKDMLCDAPPRLSSLVGLQIVESHSNYAQGFARFEWRISLSGRRWLFRAA